MGIVAALRAASRKVDQIIREEIDEPRSFSELAETAAAPSGEEPGRVGSDSHPTARVTELAPRQRGRKPISGPAGSEMPGTA